jgi:general stress protein 26
MPERMGTYNKKFTHSEIPRLDIDHRSPQEKREHLHTLLESLPDIMLGTFEAVGERPLLRTRPMHVTRLDVDCSIWIVTSIDSEAAQQVDACDSTVVTGQSGTRFVSLNGTADVVTDRDRVRSLWSRMHEVWFPGGPEDPNVGLIHFVPREAELWDVSAARGFRYLFDAAKALITKVPPAHHEGMHTVVELTAAEERGRT